MLVFGCNQPRGTTILPIETTESPKEGDLVMHGMKFDSKGNITHLIDKDTGELLPLLPDESKQMTDEYRKTVTPNNRPYGTSSR